jgi:peroxiredoxin
VRAQELKDRGVDTIAGIAVNDAWVMGAWGKSQSADDIVMLADGNGDFADAMGLSVDLSGVGLGKRSQRYAAVIDDGVVTTLAVEEGPGLKASSAEAVLASLAA